jgi:hypothetical protein
MPKPAGPVLVAYGMCGEAYGRDAAVKGTFCVLSTGVIEKFAEFRRVVCLK